MLCPILPDSFYIDINNKGKVEKILESVSETCLTINGYNPVEEARQKIRDLGEHKVADAIIVG